MKISWKVRGAMSTSTTMMAMGGSCCSAGRRAFWRTYEVAASDSTFARALRVWFGFVDAVGWAFKLSAVPNGTSMDEWIDQSID